MLAESLTILKDLTIPYPPATSVVNVQHKIALSNDVDLQLLLEFRIRNPMTPMPTKPTIGDSLNP